MSHVIFGVPQGRGSDEILPVRVVRWGGGGNCEGGHVTSQFSFGGWGTHLDGGHLTTGYFTTSRQQGVQLWGGVYDSRQEEVLSARVWGAACCSSLAVQVVREEGRGQHGDGRGGALEFQERQRR